MSQYVERDCTVTHEGREFTSGGAVVTAAFIIAYPGKDGVLKDWHGNALGTWRAVSSWQMGWPVAHRMFQIEATVNGVTYTGRGLGEGMIYRGRRKKEG
jgi:hypothetical protein